MRTVYESVKKGDFYFSVIVTSDRKDRGFDDYILLDSFPYSISLNICNSSVLAIINTLSFLKVSSFYLYLA